MAGRSNTFRTIVIVIAGLALAAISAWHAMIMSSRTLRPAVALSLDAGEPVALAKVAAAELITLEQARKPIPPAIGEQARRSLVGLALNPVALRVLATARGMDDPAKINFALVDLSDRVSRRDLSTQALRIREGGRRRDIKMVLDAYDKALTVNEASWQLLFPPLAELVKSPEGRQQFGYFLDRGAPWLSPFFSNALDSTKTPESFFALLVPTGRLAKLAGSRRIQDVLINSLVANGDWAMARQAFLYNGYGPLAALTSASLSKQTIGDGKTTLYWFFPQGSGLSAVPVGDRFLSVSAEPGYSGTVAQKVVYLRPGQYNLVIALAKGDGFDHVGLNWRVQCLSERAKAQNDLPVARNASVARLTSAFAVGPECDAVLLQLIAQGKPAARLGSEIVVETISLRSQV